MWKIDHRCGIIRHLRYRTLYIVLISCNSGLKVCHYKQPSWITVENNSQRMSANLFHSFAALQVILNVSANQIPGSYLDKCHICQKIEKAIMCPSYQICSVISEKNRWTCQSSNCPSGHLQIDIIPEKRQVIPTMLCPNWWSGL